MSSMEHPAMEHPAPSIEAFPFIVVSPFEHLAPEHRYFSLFLQNSHAQGGSVVLFRARFAINDTQRTHHDSQIVDSLLFFMYFILSHVFVFQAKCLLDVWRSDKKIARANVVLSARQVWGYRGGVEGVLRCDAFVPTSSTTVVSRECSGVLICNPIKMVNLIGVFRCDAFVPTSSTTANLFEVT